MSTLNFGKVEEVVEKIVEISKQVMGPQSEMFKQAGVVIRDSEQTDPTIVELAENFGKYERQYNEVISCYQDVLKEANEYQEIADILAKRSLGVDVSSANIADVNKTANVDALKQL